MTEDPTKQFEQINIVRTRLLEVKAAEMNKKARGEYFNPHFGMINIEDLNEDDLRIYEKILNKTLTPQEMADYSKGADLSNESSVNFLGWLNNQFMYPDMEWFDLEEYSKLIRKKDKE